MRMFAWACLFGSVVASVGCMTNNWQNANLLGGEDEPPAAKSHSALPHRHPDEKRFFFQKFGQASGVDPRARDIEKRLGY